MRRPKKNFLTVAPLFDSNETDTLLLASRFIDISENRNRLWDLHYNVPEAKVIQEIVGGDLLIGIKQPKKPLQILPVTIEFFTYQHMEKQMTK